MSQRMYLIVPISIAALVLASGTLFGPGENPTRRSARFWAWMAAAMVVVIAGLVTGLLTRPRALPLEP